MSRLPPATPVTVNSHPAAAMAWYHRHAAPFWPAVAQSHANHAAFCCTRLLLTGWTHLLLDPPCCFQEGLGPAVNSQGLGPGEDTAEAEALAVAPTALLQEAVPLRQASLGLGPRPGPCLQGHGPRCQVTCQTQSAMVSCQAIYHSGQSQLPGTWSVSAGAAGRLDLFPVKVMTLSRLWMMDSVH